MCDHVFYRACLLTALGTTRRCPTCRAEAGGRRGAAVTTLVARARVAAELVEELEVHCPHGVEQVGDEWHVKAGGCETVATRDAPYASSQCHAEP